MFTGRSNSNYGATTGTGRTRFSNHGLPRLQAVAELLAAARPLVLLREDDQAQHAGEERRRSQGVG